MSSDGGSQLEQLCDTAASAAFSVYDAYGWMVPALLLSVLFLGLLALLCWALEDLPLEPEILRGFPGIFRWSRRVWQNGRDGKTKLFDDEDLSG